VTIKDSTADNRKLGPQRVATLPC